MPALQPLLKNNTVSAEEQGIVGNWSFYNKQVGVMEQALYPIVLNNSRLYFDKDAISHKENFLAKPFLFSTVETDSITVKSFSPQQIMVYIKSDSAAQIVLQQNYYPHWFYISNNEKKPVDKYGITFMSAPVKKGNNEMVFSFEPRAVKVAMLISLISFISTCILLVYLQFKSGRK